MWYRASSHAVVLFFVTSALTLHVMIRLVY